MSQPCPPQPVRKAHLDLLDCSRLAPAARRELPGVKARVRAVILGEQGAGGGARRIAGVGIEVEVGGGVGTGVGVEVGLGVGVGVGVDVGVAVGVVAGLAVMSLAPGCCWAGCPPGGWRGSERQLAPTWVAHLEEDGIGVHVIQWDAQALWGCGRQMDAGADGAPARRVWSVGWYRRAPSIPVQRGR